MIWDQAQTWGGASNSFGGKNKLPKMLVNFTLFCFLLHSSFTALALRPDWRKARLKSCRNRSLPARPDQRAAQLKDSPTSMVSNLSFLGSTWGRPEQCRALGRRGLIKGRRPTQWASGAERESSNTRLLDLFDHPPTVHWEGGGALAAHSGSEDLRRPPQSPRRRPTTFCGPGNCTPGGGQERDAREVEGTKSPSTGSPSLFGSWAGSPVVRQARRAKVPRGRGMISRQAGENTPSVDISLRPSAWEKKKRGGVVCISHLPAEFGETLPVESLRRAKQLRSATAGCCRDSCKRFANSTLQDGFWERYKVTQQAGGGGGAEKKPRAPESSGEGTGAPLEFAATAPL